MEKGNFGHGCDVIMRCGACELGCRCFRKVCKGSWDSFHPNDHGWYVMCDPNSLSIPEFRGQYENARQTIFSRPRTLLNTFHKPSLLIPLFSLKKKIQTYSRSEESSKPSLSSPVYEVVEFFFGFFFVLENS